MLQPSRHVYLDYAAATPLDERVFVAMRPYLDGELFYNPSSPYLNARAVRDAVTEARESIGTVLGAKSSEIIITAGATESINMAIYGVMEQFPDGSILTTAIEHQAVLRAANRHNIDVAAVLSSGLIDLESLRSSISDRTVLVSVGYVNSELGTVQPIRDIASMVANERERRLAAGIQLPIYLHCDASQATGLLDIHVSRMGVDLLTINGAKCYGPKQSGLLWVKPGVNLTPLILGGGQERGLRSGTESPATIVGLARALALSDTRRKEEPFRLRVLRDTLQKQLIEALPSTIINGHHKRRSPNHLHVAWKGIDAERVLYGLDARGVMVATGSACAANKGTRSHVLTAVGMDPEIADGSIRITLGTHTTNEDIAYAAQMITETVEAELA